MKQTNKNATLDAMVHWEKSEVEMPRLERRATNPNEGYHRDRDFD